MSVNKLLLLCIIALLTVGLVSVAAQNGNGNGNDADGENNGDANGGTESDAAANGATDETDGDDTDGTDGADDGTENGEPDAIEDTEEPEDDWELGATETVRLGGGEVEEEETTAEPEARQFYYKNGRVVSHTQAPPEKSGWTVVNPQAAQWLSNNPDAIYNDDKFRLTKTDHSESIDAKYRTETTTRININTGKKTEKRLVAVCGQGAFATCDEDNPDYRYLQARERTTEYDGGKISAITETLYPELDGSQQNEPEPAAYVTTTYKDGEATNINVVNDDDETRVYFSFSADAGFSGTPNNIDQIEGLSDKQKDKLRADIVSSGLLSFGEAYDTFTLSQNLGRLIGGYDEYGKGLNQLTNLIWPEWGDAVQQRREQIMQDFALAAGIKAASVSAICGAIADFVPSEVPGVLLSRGPRGELTSNARIQAYKTPAISFKGISRDQFKRLFGNVTYINGEKYDINEFGFDDKLKKLERFDLYLYRIQYSLTNNLKPDVAYGSSQPESPTLHYNIRFEGARNANWYGRDQMLNHTKTITDHKEKYSANNYDKVCLTFDPKLPADYGIDSWVERDTTPELCTTFIDESGPPTSVTDAPPDKTQDDPTDTVDTTQPEGSAI